MKVYQGPYHHWFRPYTWVKNWSIWWLQPSGGKFDSDAYELATEWTRGNWFCQCLRRIENWFDSRYKRKIKIRIDPWDVWGADHTLAVIIVPLLKRLQEKKQGAPHVDDDDVPEHLRSTAAPEHGTGANFFKRWDWVMAEMIWAMEQVVDEDSDSHFFDHSQVDEDAEITEQFRQVKFDREGYKQHEHRVENGLKLFGKYFQALWD